MAALVAVATSMQFVILNFAIFEFKLFLCASKKQSQNEARGQNPREATSGFSIVRVEVELVEHASSSSCWRLLWTVPCCSCNASRYLIKCCFDLLPPASALLDEIRDWETARGVGRRAWHWHCYSWSGLLSCGIGNDGFTANKTFFFSFFLSLRG